MAKKPAKKSPVKKKPVLKAPLKAKKPAMKKKTRLQAPRTKASPDQEKLRKTVIDALEDAKAQDILCVDVREQSSLADYLVIASGQSSRQLAGIADKLRRALVGIGVKQVRIEGLPQGDWVIVDGGDVVAHLFRPEVRLYYRLEEVWGLEPPLQETFKNL